MPRLIRGLPIVKIIKVLLSIFIVVEIVGPTSHLASISRAIGITSSPRSMYHA